VGVFDEKLCRAEDTDFSQRLRKQGIKIYFDPNVKIRHQYGGSVCSLFRKNISAGFYRYRFFEKYKLPVNSSWRRKIRFKMKVAGNHLVGLFLKPIWRARHAESLSMFIVYLPFMYLFELGISAGVFMGLLGFSIDGRTPHQKIVEG
jgi:GT2 family glycosyltransferase